MNEDKQRIAIAEVCGWRKPTGAEVAMVWPNEKTRDMLAEGGRCFFMVPPDGNAWDGFCDGFPNYPTDLNAMREAEGVLWSEPYTEDDRCEHANILAEICGQHEWHATAAQRAEAFLRTTGRWVEEEVGA